MNRFLVSTLLSAALLMSGPLLQAAPGGDKSADSALIAAVTIMDGGDLQAAAEAFAAIAAKNPEYDAAHYYLGVCYAMLGQIERAQDHMREALRLDSGNVWYQDYLARICAAAGNTEEAASIYEDMLAAHPDKTDTYFSLANLYSRLGMSDKVMQTLDEIERTSGDSEMLATARYRILMEQKKDQEAWEVLERYNDKYTSEEVLSLMGDHKLSQYEDSLAIMYYDEALSYNPLCGPALLGKAEALRIGRKYPEFFQALDKYVSLREIPQEASTGYLGQLFSHSDSRFLQNFRSELDSIMVHYMAKAPSDSTTLNTCGAYYYNTRRPEIAEDCFKRAAEAYPQSLSLRYSYLMLLGQRQRWEQLVVAAEDLYTDFPEETDALQLKSTAYFNLGDYNSFIAEQERIIAASGENVQAVVQAWSGIGDAWHLLGDSAKAYKAYDKALSLNPKYLPVLNNYAYYLSEERRKLKKAYAMSKITVEAEPDNATYGDTFGWILHLQGKDLEAKPFFKHAMLYGGKDSAVMLDHYAEVLYALGEYDMAKVYWNMAKKKNTRSEVPDLDRRVAERLAAIEKK